ncbi:MAG: YebC/PmpR family DNA-binding transcriptional regulator [Patescibacteria group bacterium]
MAGHNKWSKIKRQKAVTDSKKGKTFSQLSKMISLAAKNGGGDADANPSLRLALEKARQERLPKENIQRAINRGLGIGSDAPIDEVLYEGYAPNGVAVLVKCATDNRNRTVSEIRLIFNKNNGSLGESGSAAYVFGDTPEEPTFFIDLDEESYTNVEVLIEALEENDDVIEVFHNARIT